MKNLKYFPYERNRYFYGKLLSVDDFEIEQRYMNDKRRMLNRLLYGSGVVCGLQVVELDEVTISIEMGVALDFSGREIVVDKPVTKRLSAIEGFSNYAVMEEGSRDLYLCIAYDEQMKEPVHNITRMEYAQEEEFNKYVEGYRLYITSEEPEQENKKITELYESTQTIFEGHGIRIRQTVPKYIQSDTLEYFTVSVEKKEQTKLISFSYQVRLSCLEQDGNDTFTVSFDEKNFEPAKQYEWRIPVRAKAVENISGYMENVADSLMLKIGEETRSDFVQGRFAVYVTEDTVPRTVIHNYYQTAMEDIIRNNYEQPVYLARLEVLRAGSTYVIEKLENQPYQQYVWNNVLSEALEAMRLQRPLEMNLAQNVPVHGSSEKIQLTTSDLQIRTGSILIDLGIGGITNQYFFSEEIVHGLGLGNVFISLSLMTGTHEGAHGIFGNTDIFNNVKYPKVKLAAKADFERGNFVIGVKCLEEVDVKQIRVSWMAVKNVDTREQEERTERLTIYPDILNLQIRESHYFEARIGDEVQKHINWSVKELTGGTIDTNGCYTAPNQVGVYEIIAESIENRALRAAAFVIVRDVV